MFLEWQTNEGYFRELEIISYRLDKMNIDKNY